MGICLLMWASPSYAQDLTAEDYEHATQFLWFNTRDKVFRDNVRPVWLEDGRFWYSVSTASGDEYVLIDPKRKRKTTASSRAELLGEENDQPANDSRIGRYEVPSPDGKKVVFIREWNLWMRNLETGEETQLTTDGTENFGYATDNAGWRKSDKPVVLWSPDSRKIATFQQDQRHVSDMYLVSTKVGAPELQAWKYPLPQDEDIIRIHRVIIEVDDPKVIRLKMDPDPRRGTQCDDISCSGAFDDNQWNADASELMFVSTSRDHKVAQVRIANAETGMVRDVFTEKVDTQYESGQGTINWHWLPESNELIWYSERSDWGHLYMYDATSGEVKYPITSGNYVVTEMEKVDEDDRMIYFYA
ncbi:MAG: DPP IV N-terminal domain-containing protein, partial [Cyclobacteriaceae bacterium]